MAQQSARLTGRDTVPVTAVTSRCAATATGSGFLLLDARAEVRATTQSDSINLKFASGTVASHYYRMMPRKYTVQVVQ